jgi:Uma2 family endonuclease
MSTVATAFIPENLAELLDRLGDLPPERIRLRPPPGTATEQDLLVRQEGVKRLCELVDGVLVEKPMGFYESRLAAVLIALLEAHARSRDLGIVVGADGATRLEPGLVRLPDVAFISRGRLPGGTVPHEPIPDLAPDLAVEIISRGNTRKEMERKLREYFAAGVRRVWYVSPDTRTVRVYRSPDQVTQFNEDQILDGEDLLPGFALPIRDWFGQAE